MCCSADRDLLAERFQWERDVDTRAYASCSVVPDVDCPSPPLRALRAASIAVPSMACCPFLRAVATAAPAHDPHGCAGPVRPRAKSLGAALDPEFINIVDVDSEARDAPAGPAQERERGQRSGSAPAACSRARVACLCPLRVLVADDNEMNRVLARRAFAAACPNATVDVVVDGQEAFNLFMTAGDRPYDAAVLDFEMPNLNGLETAQAMREAERWRNAAPAQLVSWSTCDGLRERCAAAGFDEAHSKSPMKPVVAAALARLRHAEHCPAAACAAAT